MTASMEDLVRYCVQEIAHDGDLGSTLSRVGSFMNEYYTRNPPPDEQQRSTFQALFEELRKQPHIQIGLAPTATTEVIIGQPEKKPEKKKTTGKRSSIQTVEPVTPDPDVMELGETGIPAKSPADGLELVPDVDAVPAMDLVGNYGERLRIAVDPEFSSLTLTRIADRTIPRTNPRLYTCLQFIARSRGNGLSADAVAAATGYDLKICYHHIRHLAAMDLIQKLRKNDFTRVDFCVHRDYLHLVPDDWTYSPRTTRDSQQGTSARGSVADDAEFESGSERLDPTHEATPRLLRERVVALLKAGQDTALPYTQLFAAAGYKSDQGSQDWDFFCATVEDMVRDGELVKSLKKAAAGAPVLCVRLPGDQPPDPVAARMQPTRMRPRKSINNGSTTIDDDDSSVDIAPPVSTSMKRGAEDGPTGEPPLKRKRGRPRKDEVEARAATQPTPDPKSAKKDDSHARDASPPWATKRKAGPRPPSPAYVPKRIPTPPWAELDRPGRPQTPPPPPPPKHTPASLAKLDPVCDASVMLP
ncbi:hypothetical protein EXIGLDRAFT_130729 [Exidia glandulosa HHB12029]|uniref:Uncharacterized protein n=1 Tax=Exidia glandulosa HHB12029 TaxID=1314781 RepID=A0A165G446_EXIGL|nr:hypothetical protein EXIGLDRAFT_130729 [Exidia glandulosa HHB12029]